MSDQIPVQPEQRLVVPYIAHPFGQDPERNRAKARRWVRWAVTSGYAPEAMWILLTELFDDATPEQRALGLRVDCALVERCDEVWLVGGHVSLGMATEARHALECGIPVLDLTGLGSEPPALSMRAYREDARVLRLPRELAGLVIVALEQV